MKRQHSLIFAALLAAGCSTVWAQSAGEVEYARGVGAAKKADGNARILGKGLPVQQGDTITTGENSYAIVKMNDGTKMTVRPNSQLTITTFDYKEGREENSMVLGLLKGGLRAITGIIPKRSATGARIETATATIGIRGTDFDARICAADCAAENGRTTSAPVKSSIKASARVVAMAGDLSATANDGTKRKLSVGGSMYPGETIDVANRGHAVLAFRDESKVTVQSGSTMKINDFVYDDKNPAEGKFLLNLVKGGLRAVTGLIGKANNKNVAFQSATATIGIRGTGIDFTAAGSLYVWQGEAVLQAATPAGTSPFGGGASSVVVGTGQYAVLGAGNNSPSLLPPPPAVVNNPAPNPGTVQVNFQQQFGQTATSGNDPGVYVQVRDGHISITQNQNTLDLGAGEVGFLNPVDGTLLRPVNVPNFIQFDNTPQANQTGGKTLALLNSLVSQGVKPVCKQ